MYEVGGRRPRVDASAVVAPTATLVGDPAILLPSGDHDRIWEIQRGLDFPGTVYGVERREDGTIDMHDVTRRAVARDHPGWTPVD